MKYAVLIFLIGMISIPSNSQSIKRFFYVSSYDKEYTAGIALFQLDYTNGKIEKLKEFDAEANSDYLAISPNNLYLLSVAMDEDKNSGLITSFSINTENGELSYEDEEPSGGTDPCYITINKKSSCAIIAHYSGGNVTVASLLENGNLSGIIDNKKHQGSGPNKERQEGPHPHMCYYSPKGNYIFVPDLGLDKIMVYKLNDNGHLKSAKSPYGKVTPGAGPRHFVLHPGNNFGYVVNELNSTITAFSFSKKSGELSEIQVANSLKENFEGDNYLADVHISPDGRFLYASNRGHDSISIFAIDQSTGKLNLIKNESCGGKWPRAFNIDPTGQFLIVANEHSDNLVLFNIDQDTGLLKMMDEANDFPAPRCIKFLN